MHGAGENLIFDPSVTERGSTMRTGSVEGYDGFAGAEKRDLPSAVEDPKAA